jgi:hypothetical protein
MLHQKSEKITVVLYDEAKKAVTFTLKRGLIRRTVISVLLLIAILLTSIAYLILSKRKKDYYKFENYQKEQIYIKDREDLLAKIQLLTDENNTLLMKLNSVSGETVAVATPTSIATSTPEAAVPTPASTPTAAAGGPQIVADKPHATSPTNISYDIFNNVKRPIGFKDLTSQNLVKVDNVQFSQNQRGLTVNFDLINNASETKITGYALVVQRGHDGQVAFYPSHPAYLNVTKVPYNIGEQFGFSRMRPVVASFRHKYLGSNVFTILIFTRAGDLLLKKEVGPYEIK